MDKDTVIHFDHVYKEYKLGAIGGQTLREDLQSWAAKLRGKEDPNSIIGSEKALMGSSGRFLALNDVSFDVQKGDTLGIIGGNGAGKSTLLKLLSCVTAPTKGSIYVEGRIASMLEVGTGFHPELTGRENIYLNGAILGMTKAEITRKLDEIIDFSECERFIDTPVKRYSSGMYVKLAFSVAAHLDSEILVMDEVLAVGDAKFQEKCLGKMGDVATNQGRTVLYVSHNMSTIRKLCNRCVVLDHGKLIFSGDVEQAVDLYLDSSAAIQSSKIDLASCKRHGIPSGGVCMKYAEFLNRENTSLEVNEAFQLHLEWIGNRNIDNLFLRLHVMKPDGTCVGIAYGESVTSCYGANCAEYMVKLDGLMPGKYSVTLIFYEKNSYGVEIRHECIEPAFSMEIVSDSSQDNFFEWNPVWGAVQFPTIRVKQ